MSDLSILKYGNPILGIAPDATIDCEGVFPPAGWTSWGIPTYGSIDQSVEQVHGGAASAKLIGTTPNNGIGRANDSLAIATQRFHLRGWARLESIASDNTSCKLFFSGKLVSPYNYIGPMVDRRGGKYYWALGHTYNSFGRITTTVELQPNTWYDLELGVAWLKVNGVLVANGGTLVPDVMNYLGIGSYTGTYDGVYTAYVDDIAIRANQLRFSYGIIADDGSWINCSAYKTSHSSTDSVIKCFRSPDQGATWTLQATLSVSGKDHSPYSITKRNGVIYLVGFRGTYGSPHDYQCTVYTSGDNGQTWSPACDVSEGVLFFPSAVITDGTKLACLLWEVDATWNIGRVRMAWYDTADDTYTLGATLSAVGDIASCTPNESTLYRAPGGDLVALLRWDDTTGADQLFITAQRSGDNGGTWGARTNLSATWGMIGGTPSVAKIGGRYYLAGYKRTGSNVQSVVFRFDPDTYALIGAMETPADVSGVNGEEGGNGVLQFGPAYNQLTWTADLGSSSMYILEVAGITAPGGFPVINRTRRLRRAA